MSAFAYLVKVLRMLLAAGLFATLLLGETRPAHAQERRPADQKRVDEAKRDYADAQDAVREGRLADAREKLEEALQLVPRFTDAQYLLGFLYAKAERWQDALGHYEKALEIGPPQAVHHYGVGVCKRALGDPKAAKESFEKARELASAGLASHPEDAAVKRALAEVDYQLACLARDDGDDAACARCLDSALANDPSSAKIKGEKGVLLLRTGDAAGAVKALEAAVAAAPDDLALLYQLGRALVASGREAEGKETLERYRKLDEERRARVNEQRRKDQAQVLAARAELALRDGKKDEARDLAKKAYAFDGTNSLALKVLAATQ